MTSGVCSLGKKRKSNNKQFWGLSIENRMVMGKDWVKEYKGENIVKDYSKSFGLNLKNSLKELRKLGASIRDEQIEIVERFSKEKVQRRINKREKKKQEDLMKEYEDSDDTFAYIAGYTDGGAPFGITYEEMEEDIWFPVSSKNKIP
jgi:hypothetical protein